MRSLLFLLQYDKTTCRCNTASNLIICVCWRLQTWFLLQSPSLNGVIRTVSSGFIRAQRTDVSQHSNFTCLLKRHPANPPSDCREPWLTRDAFHAHSTFLPASRLISIPCCFLNSTDAEECLKSRTFPSFFETKLHLNDAKWKKSVLFSYCLSSSLHCADLH